MCKSMAFYSPKEPHLDRFSKQIQASLQGFNSQVFVQIAAETYVINQSFDGSGKNLNGVDSIGLMVYEGTETLKWTKSYTNGPEQGQGAAWKRFYDRLRSSSLGGTA